MTDAAPTRSSAPPGTPTFTLSDDAASYSLSTSTWLREVWTRGFRFVLDEDWFVDADAELLECLPGDAAILHHARFELWEGAVLEVGDSIAQVSLHRGSLDVTVGSRELSQAQACLALIKQA